MKTLKKKEWKYYKIKEILLRPNISVLVVNIFWWPQTLDIEIIENQWIFTHYDLLGIEKADDLANQGTFLDK